MRFYQLDANDTIIATDPGWDCFARANGGQGAVAERVVGRSLWEFISSADTIGALKLAFHNARRTEIPWGMRYRCDSARQDRLFQLTAIPLAEQALMVRHALIRSSPRIRAASAPAQTAETLLLCSHCLTANGVPVLAPLPVLEAPAMPGRTCRMCRATVLPAQISRSVA